MAFYHPDGFVPAYKQAAAFAGKDGRVATLPDIIAARLATKPGEYPWGAYFTTMSAEYVGYSRQGNPIAIVAHGFGPMATLDGVLKTYSFQFNDKTHTNRGGRISGEDFLKLESGFFGPVSVVGLDAVWNRRTYQFSNHAISIKEIEEEPLWQDRLGPSWEAYVAHHTKFAQKYHEEQGHPHYERPCILAMDSASNCSYSTREIFDHLMKQGKGMAIGHLLSIGGLKSSGHQYYEYDYELRTNRISLDSDVTCHEWYDGTRLVGIKAGQISEIHSGLPSYSTIIKKHLDKLWGHNPNGSKEARNGFWHLVEIGDRFFTDYPKQGERMDNHEPEFLVTKIERVGEQQFRTTIGGYYGFFKYGIDEVKRIAPPEANAYTVGDIDTEWTDGNPTHHVASVTFYKVTVDTTRRLIRQEDIYRDFDMIMSLVD